MWQLPFVSLNEREEIPPDVGVLLSSSRDEFSIPNQFKGDNPLQALRSSLARLFMKEKFDNLVIGIDPGPYPGIAVFADGVMMEAYECPLRENLSDEVRSIVNTYCFNQLQVKVGNGDAPNRDYIIERLRDLNLRITVVDEKNTSFPHKIHDNALSAARIANVESKYELSRQWTNVSRKNMFEKEFKTLRNQVRTSL